ncbi:MAG: class I SAM-dependent methyltransferase [Spirochaetales bacterium]|jgi:SAM-dependent methyltransferase|nr:class I SAM-dependent methyltransferase [Spirochaetales bacterium]
MFGAMTPLWPKAAQVFHERAEEYDGWFDESLLFDIELAALHDLQTMLHGPRLEVGVGPGRFAKELDVCIGIDPAMGALALAAQRLTGVCRGVGESLPVQSGAVATVFLLFTLCFTENPALVIREIARALKPQGHLVLGVVPRESPWGKYLRMKKKDGHPFYQHSHFYDIEQIAVWLKETGLVIVEERSSLLQRPGDVTTMEPSRRGRNEDAGFMILVAQK